MIIEPRTASTAGTAGGAAAGSTGAARRPRPAASSAEQHDHGGRRAGAAPRADAARRELARRRIVGLTRLLDGAVRIPGLQTRVGLDALLGVVPVAGDIVSALLSLVIVREARHLGASRWLQARMLGNVVADVALGAVPVAGDVIDVFFRANLRNVRLLQQALGEPWMEGDDRTVEGRARVKATPPR